MCLMSFRVVLVFVFLFIGLTVCRSDSDFHRLDNVTATTATATTTTLPNDTDSDSTGDKEIIPSKYVDNGESQHSSDDKPSERHRRESNDATDKLRENVTEDKIDKATELPPSPANDTTSASVSTTTASNLTTNANIVGEDTSFEVYLTDYLKKNPDAQLLRSPKHFDNQNQTWILNVTKGSHVEVIIHLLDINPFSNYLTIQGAKHDDNSLLKIVGPVTPKNVTKIVQLNTQQLVVTYQFANSQSSKYEGFVLTYRSICPIQNSTKPSNATMPSQQYPHIKVLLEVAKAKQTNETLAQLRLLFVQSANQFIVADKLPVEQAKLDDVKFIDVLPCPSTWPNGINCIQIKVAIPVKFLSNATQKTDDISADDNAYELNYDHLLKMWLVHGRQHFAKYQFREFIPPNARSLLLLWTSISACILTAFLLVLYCIWKIDLLKDYRRMHWKMSEDQKRMCKQSEIDISMFPSPHQTVPPLFPNELTVYASASMTNAAVLPYEYVSQPIAFSESDFRRREDLDESMKLGADTMDKHEAGVVPFQSEIIDFNEPHAEDEITFSGATGESPRGQIKFRPNSKNDTAPLT